jgi:hypothetical protein
MTSDEGHRVCKEAKATRDQREKMPKGTIATARAKGGVEGRSQRRPKGGGSAGAEAREMREGREKTENRFRASFMHWCVHAIGGGGNQKKIATRCHTETGLAATWAN